ncbi:SIMPL domain-containing protein [Azotosporobacter soli]|uniref:SIMPL domain-containing protein n=1 Tax=Azotosporobacter soli TaxID=3055040 RepID=UPI0031FF3C8F
MKRYLKYGIAMVLGLLLFIPATSQASEAKTITVQGQAQFYLQPDRADIEIAVQSNGATLAEAQNENARIAQAVQNKLLALGVERDQIQTSHFNVYPVYSDANGHRPGEISGYQVSNAVSVKLQDVALVGPVIDGALSSGATQISNLRFGKKDEMHWKQSALQSAVKDAMGKAEAIAGALNRPIIGPLSVSESSVHFGGNENTRDYMMFKASAMRERTPIETGLIQVQATVNLVVEI